MAIFSFILMVACLSNLGLFGVFTPRSRRPIELCLPAHPKSTTETDRKPTTHRVESFRDKFARNRMRMARTKRKCSRFISMPHKLTDELTVHVAFGNINDLQLALALLKADYFASIRSITSC